MVKQIETILSNCFITPNIVAFIVPHEKEDNYEFAIRSKWAAIMGNNENQKLSKMTLIQVKQINEAQDQLFGNLLACNRDLSRESQLVKMNAYQRPTNSRFSFVKHEIIRKKSISTFRLFSALGIHQQRRQHVKPSNNIFINRRSRTTTARKPITTRVTSAAVNNESNSNDLDNHNSSIYRSCLSSINSSNLSIKSQYSEESINKLISPLNSLEKQSTNRRSLSLSPSPLVSSQYQSTFYRLANASLLTNNQEQRGLNVNQVFIQHELLLMNYSLLQIKEDQKN
ncbi:uncharacterized protein BX663DRAFT_218689 [Cokeromyces recurvatus]|uniref:uncharacterized protein n=1 Tax=Cokeromyces recurvatus TaxID=90255 RepID=UPI0022205D7A|nr:uncharacterized protein BX663DRAFT_218689 [Cokeromyces recurvatus]KAI7899301.1 hypothetical protein BX663DRAFT_218689 [Cokeromyces recurvatus]